MSELQLSTRWCSLSDCFFSAAYCHAKALMYHDSSRALARADLETGCSSRKGALVGSDRCASLSHHAGNAKPYPARRGWRTTAEAMSLMHAVCLTAFHSTHPFALVEATCAQALLRCIESDAKDWGSADKRPGPTHCAATKSRFRPVVLDSHGSLARLVGLFLPLGHKGIRRLDVRRAEACRTYFLILPLHGKSSLHAMEEIVHTADCGTELFRLRAGGAFLSAAAVQHNCAAPPRCLGGAKMKRQPLSPVGMLLCCAAAVPGRRQDDACQAGILLVGFLSASLRRRGGTVPIHCLRTRMFRG